MRQGREPGGVGESGLLILFQNSRVDFVAMDLHRMRRFDAETDLSALYLQYDDPYIRANRNPFRGFSSQDQHAVPGEGPRSIPDP